MASRSSSPFSPSISPPFHNIGTAAIDNNGSRYNGKIIVVSLAMLFFVLVFILALHIYAKWFWLRSTARRRSHLQEASTSHVFNRTFRHSFNSLIYAHETPLIGLHKSTIDSLPTFIYSARTDAACTPQRECAVCLSEFQENEKCRVLPKCSHSFHVSCIDKWFSSHTTCPLCRANVEMGGDLAIELNDWTTNMGSVASTQSQSSDANAESDGHGPMTADDSDVRPSLPLPGWTWRRSISERFLHAPRAGVQFPTNVLFWGDHGSLNSHTNTISMPSHLHLNHGTSSPDGAITVDATPHRSSSFSAMSGPSFGNCDEHQHLPLRTASGGSQFNAFKRLLCRDKKVFPTQLQQEKDTGHGPGTSGS